MILEITNQWTALGTTLAATVNAQNLGRAGDLIEIITGDTQPIETQRGYALTQLNKTYRISGYDGLIWARYIRYDLNGTNKPADARVCLLNVQEGAVVTEVADIPLQVLTGGELSDSARLKVSSSTRQENQIVKGDFFVGESVRPLIPVDNDYYTVIKAPADKYLVIEDAILAPVFEVNDSSNFSISLTGFVDISNGNDWSYTAGSPLPVGRPLNAELINSISTATIDLGVTVGAVTGRPDYPLFFATYYLETQGQRETVTTTGSSFFDKDRQIILAPSQELLIRTQTTGTSVGTVDLTTVFFMSEIDVADAPSMIGLA